MIKAKVVSVTYSESVGGIPKLDLETHLEDPVVPELFCGADFWDGLDVVIMSKEEYEAMDSSSNVLRQSLLEEREKTKQLKDKTKKLEEENKTEASKNESLRKKLIEKEGEICKLCGDNRKLAAKNTDIQYERMIATMTNSRLSEIVKEYKETIQKLREENTSIKDEIKDLKEKLAQDAAELDIHPDGTMVFKSKRVSELEKEVKKLKEENKYLKESLLDRLKVKLDPSGKLVFYTGSKED